MARLLVVLAAALRRLRVTEDAVFLGRARLPVLCPVRRVTGHRCPGCGMTRVVLLLLRGRVRASFAVNPAWPLVLAAVVRATVLTRARPRV